MHVLRRYGLPALLAAAAVATALSSVIEWERITTFNGPQWWVGWELEQGRWLIAICLAALVWVVVYLIRRDAFTALASVGFAISGLSVGLWAVDDFGSNAVEPVIAASVWVAISLVVLGEWWWADGHKQPIVITIFSDFRFTHFLATSLIGLLWVLGMAASTASIFWVAIESMHEESVLTGLLAALVALVLAIIWLLWFRLILETIAVLFRIYGELRSSNASRRPTAA
jgi:hypothetical protein